MKFFLLLKDILDRLKYTCIDNIMTNVGYNIIVQIQIVCTIYLFHPYVDKYLNQSDFFFHKTFYLKCTSKFITLRRKMLGMLYSRDSQSEKQCLQIEYYKC